jgi:hypothetical protein
VGLISIPETTVATNLRCVTSEKSEDLLYVVAEARNHEYL